MALLEVRQLRAGYAGRPVLHGLDLSLQPCETLLVVGPNGAGKTTLLRALAGVIAASGLVLMDGRPLSSGQCEERARCGLVLVPDTRGNFMPLTVLENLRLGAHSRPDRGAIAADLDRLLERFPRLGQLRRRPAAALSGGEQQMLAIARALMARPRLLMLDEPSAGLAPRAAEVIQEILAGLQAELGLALLMVEQESTPAWTRADRALLIEAGQQVLEGRPDAVRVDPRFESCFLGGLSA
jgi:branched-chain amino acid transport system ATP-binding protein